MRSVDIRRQLRHGLDRVVEQSQEVSCVEVDAQPRRIDRGEQRQHFIRGEIDMVFHCHADAVLFGHLDGFAEHASEALDLRPVRLVAKP